MSLVPPYPVKVWGTQGDAGFQQRHLHLLQPFVLQWEFGTAKEGEQGSW